MIWYPYEQLKTMKAPYEIVDATLAFGYVIPAIRAYSGLAPVGQCSCRAYTKKAVAYSLRSATAFLLSIA